MIFYIAEFREELSINEGQEIVASSLSEAVAKFCYNNRIVGETVWVRMPEADGISGEVVEVELEQEEEEEEGDDDE